MLKEAEQDLKYVCYWLKSHSSLVLATAGYKRKVNGRNLIVAESKIGVIAGEGSINRSSRSELQQDFVKVSTIANFCNRESILILPFAEK
jgi:hypothetical protein